MLRRAAYQVLAIGSSVQRQSDTLVIPKSLLLLQRLDVRSVTKLSVESCSLTTFTASKGVMHNSGADFTPYLLLCLKSGCLTPRLQSGTLIFFSARWQSRGSRTSFRDCIVAVRWCHVTYRMAGDVTRPSAHRFSAFGDPIKVVGCDLSRQMVRSRAEPQARAP